MNRFFALLTLACLAMGWARAQTAFSDFNSAGQLATNFNVWNDVGGTDGGNYSYQESTNSGVAGSGGISVFQSSDTTAAYQRSSWDLSTNGAVVIVSVLVKANGLTSGNKVQLGLMNANQGGLNNNAGRAFETFRFIPTGPNNWSLREQLRSSETLVETILGDVPITIGNWYKFTVSITNVSGASGNINASCEIDDYGTNGVSPGLNIVTFSTLRSNAGQTIGTLGSVWPALRAFQSGGIDAWDNFTVYTPSSKPVFTQSLADTVGNKGQVLQFSVLTDGPGPISYLWYTNGTAIAGATNGSFTSPPLTAALTSISVVATNPNGASTSSAAISIGQPPTINPPSVANLAATAVLANRATLSGVVTATGGEAPTVALYYGTADGGTNGLAWDHKLALDVQRGSFTQTVMGLVDGTVYYFTALAQNSAGATWATPSLSFATPKLLPATLTNQVASALQADSALLSGAVLATGGDVPSITLYYGTSDGGTDPAAWGNKLELGAQSGPYTQSISGLISNTTYFATARAINVSGTSWASPTISFTTLVSNSVPTLVSVLTYHNDNMRHGVNTNETQLTLANVASGLFGKVFSQPVDGYVYAQPLIVPNVTIPGKGVHNVVYIATEHDTIYAFDADSASGANAAPLWQVSFLNPAAGVTSVPGGDVGTSDIVPEVGMTATPVIDPVTATIYLEAKTKEIVQGRATYVHRLHALDLATGAERTNGPVFNSPVIINATNYPGTGTPGFGDNDGKGHVTFDTQREHSRPALTLVNSVIYIGFASHGDNQPYHGWLFAYDAHSLAQLSVYCTTPNGGLGGFWQGGGGATVDSAGNLYLETGNGSFDATGATYNQARNSFAMSVLKFSPTNGVLTLTDYFSPHDQAALSGGDVDLGSGASIVLPDSAGTAAHPHLVVASGKGNRIYVLDRDNMGHFRNGNDNQIVQTVPFAFDGGQDGSYMTPVYFNNTLYYIGMNDRMKAFKMTNGVINTTPTLSPTFFGDKGSSSPSLSANGTDNAIIWATESDAYASSGPGILHAYNATNITQELYNSSQNLARDNPGGAVKFTVPTIANGRVYVGSQYRLTVYGLGSFLATPAITPDGGIFTNSITVSISDATPGVTIYYTLDGTTPTAASLRYSGPFVLRDSTGVQAVAIKAGAVNSGIASAGFLNSSAIGTGTGLLGSYYTAHLANDPFSGPPALVRTDATINFDWGNGSPDPKISADSFTARWTGSIQPQFSETYTFTTTTDDGVRLYVDGQLLVDEWVDQGPTPWSGSLPLVAQQRYDIVMEYYENGGGAVAQLAWSSPSTPLQTIPETQLYPVTNPPPVAILTSPATNAFYTATASITATANAAAQYNPLREVDFYANSTLIGTVTAPPYTVTATGFETGKYAITAVAIDGSGKTGTSAPVNVTVTAGSGQPYGVATRAPAAAYGNMPTSAAGGIPTKLSQTGFFADTPKLLPVNGMIPYAPAVPFWSDDAAKTRWMSVPNSGTPYTPDEQIGFSPTGEWTFPAGTVFVKHFDLATDYSNPGTPRRRLETRLIVRDNFGAVYGVTYKWRADNSEADLLTNSLSENIVITNADSSTWTQTWYYPSPADCLLCHTRAANYVLGVKTRQLDSNFTYPLTGLADNQLRTLNHAGLFYPAIDEAAIAGYSHLAALGDTNAPLEDRARSYLDANCANCHRPGATGPSFDARWDTPLAQQNLVGALPQKGNLGIDNALIVAPKDIWRSVLYQRAHSLDPAVKMPTLARNLVDTNSLAVVAEWIDSLAGTPALEPPTITPDGGTYNGAVTITLTASSVSQAVYYTLDGSLPSTNSLAYREPFPLTSSATLRAKSFADGYVDSASSTAVFAVNPGLSLVATGFNGAGFQVTVAGLPGRTCILEGSSDLVHWMPVSTNLPTASPFVVTDPGTAGSPYRFYRAVQP